MSNIVWDNWEFEKKDNIITLKHKKRAGNEVETFTFDESEFQSLYNLIIAIAQLQN